MNTKAVAAKLVAEALKSAAALNDPAQQPQAIGILGAALDAVLVAELRGAMPAAQSVVERLLALKPEESKHKGVKISLELFAELQDTVRALTARNAIVERETGSLLGFPLKLSNEGDGVVRVEDVRCTVEALKAFFNPPTPQLLIVKRNGDTLELTRLSGIAERQRALCYLIEALPASEQQTAISVEASAISQLLQPSAA